MLRALDESGVKIDLVVGSGIGAVSAAYAAVGGGPKLYGEGGFWDGRALGLLLPPPADACGSRSALLGVSFGDLRAPRRSSACCSGSCSRSS